MSKNSISYVFLGDSTNLRSAARQVETALGKTETGFEQAGRKAAGMGDRMLPASAALGALGLAAIDAASDSQQAAGAVESVLGQAASKVQQFGETSAEAYGISGEEADRMGALIGATLTGMGFDVDDAADQVVNLEKRAADMAATFGGSTSEAIEAVGSALRGERDPIERYGVSIKQADVEARILADGLDTSTAAAKKQAEATATLNIIMDKTASTAGQFAREADSVAGQQAIAAATASDLAAEFGESLLPIAQDVLGVVTDVVSVFRTLPEPMQEGIVKFGLMAAAAGPLLSVGGRVVETFGSLHTKARELHAGMDALRAMAGKTTPSFGAMAGAVGGVGAAIGLAIAVYAKWRREQEESAQRVEALTDTLDANTGAITDNTRAFVVDQLEKKGALEAARDLGIALDDLTDAALGNEAAHSRVTDALAGQRTRAAELVETEGDLSENALLLKIAIDKVGGSLSDTTSELGRAKEAQDRKSEATQTAINVSGYYVDAVGDVTAATEDEAAATEDATSALQRHGDVMRAQLDPIFGVSEASRDYQEALADLTAVQGDADASAEDLADAQRNVAEKAVDLRGKLAELVDENGNLKVSADEARAQLAKLGIPPEVVERIMQDLDGVLTELRAVDALDPEVLVTVDTAEALRRLAELNERIREAGGGVTVDIHGDVTPGPSPGGAQTRTSYGAGASGTSRSGMAPMTVTSSPTVNVTIHGAGVTDEDLADAVASAVAQSLADHDQHLIDALIADGKGR